MIFFPEKMDVEFNNNVIDDKYVILQDLLLKGDDLQKLSIIQALPQLARIDQQATFSRIVPKIQQELPKASSEFQITTSQIFRILIEKQVPVNLLGAVVQGVDSRDPVVSSAWMETLLAVIPLLNEEMIKNEILPLIVIKSQLSQPVIQRVAGCRIIGKIANHPKLKPSDIKKDVLPFVHSLCQDCSVEVRAVMCMQLPFVAEGMGSNIVKTQLLACFVELASDNNSLVREAAVLTMINMFPYLDSETIQNTMVPLIKKFCEKLIPEDNIAAIIASQIGAIMEHVLPCISNEDKVWFLTYYKILAHRGFEVRPGGIHNADASKDVVCRENCASNLPAMAKFVNAAIPQHMDVLYSIFRDLAGDPCYIVRRSVAACLHQIAEIIGSQNKMLKVDFVRLLRDDSEDVLQMLVPNLNKTLVLLSQYGFLSKDRTDQCTIEISRAMTKCQIELSKGYNWRLLTQFIEQLECMPKCMPGDFIHQHFTPMVLGNAANGRAKPIRYQATRTLLIFLRHNIKENQQKWLRDALITQFCYSDSCYTRQIYVTICLQAMEIFSCKYFKEYFFLPLISLGEDPISNVRYKFIKVLPQLKLITLVPPADTKYKVLLQDTIAKLEQKEKQQYVLELLKQVVKEVQNVSLASNKDFQTKDFIKQEQEEFGMQSSERPVNTITATQIMRPKPTPSATPSKPGHPSSAQHRVTKPPPVDMNFLEHHFYIDAGVNLPEVMNGDEEADSCGAEAIATLTIETDVKNSPVNMTDDVKVNLRKVKSGGNLQSRALSCGNITLDENGGNLTRSKRHSSVFSSSCLDDTSRKLQNRRSLNIVGREPSKIPICTRNFWTNSNRSHRNNFTLTMVLNEIDDRPPKSNLPVAIRRPHNAK